MAIRTLLQRIRNVPYSFLDRQDREEKLTFNILVGRHLRDITAAVGGLQIIFAFLAFINLLNPTVRSKIYYVDILADDSFWAGAFLITGILVMASLHYMELRAVGMAMSAACLSIWGVVIFFKALTAVTPVALSVGFTAFTIGIIAYKVCVSWNVIMFKQRYLTMPDIDQSIKPVE